MKKLTILLLSVMLFQWASAQYCGSPDTLACATTNVPDSNGLYPPVDSFPPFLNNFLTSTTIYFRNFDSILFGTEALPVYSLTWDTIENLPPGLCWSTNQSNNTYATGQAGCIHIRGLPCGPTGQYKLSTLVTVDIGIPVETDGDPGGLGYMVRLENPGDTLVPIDTSQTDSTPFIPYGGICQNLSPLSVNLGPDQTVCAGSIVTFNPVVNGGQPPYSYSWQSFGSTIICPVCGNASVTITQNSTYVLEVMDESGEYGYDTINYTITGAAYNFQVTAIEPTVFCAGGTVTISANANDSVSFQWYNGTGGITGATANTLTVTDTPGAYYLIYTEAGICDATSNIINILFYDTTGVTITSQSSDTICQGGEVTLTANATGTGLSYEWLAADTGLNYTGTDYIAISAGVYQVVVTNAVGCNDTSAGVLVIASPNAPPVLTYNQFPDDTVCNNAAPITLTGAQPPGGYYSGRGVLNGVFTPSAATAGFNLIYYNYTDSTGCSNAVADTIDVELCTAIPDLNIPDIINLYPDPGVDYLVVQSTLLMQDNPRISVYDLTGKLLPVSYQRNANDKARLNIAPLSAGCYIIRLSVNGAQLSRRFMKMD